MLILGIIYFSLPLNFVPLVGFWNPDKFEKTLYNEIWFLECRQDPKHNTDFGLFTW